MLLGQLQRQGNDKVLKSNLPQQVIEVFDPDLSSACKQKGFLQMGKRRNTTGEEVTPTFFS